jgi:hypothetical protein
MKRKINGLIWIFLFLLLMSKSFFAGMIIYFIFLTFVWNSFCLLKKCIFFSGVGNNLFLGEILMGGSLVCGIN